MQIHQLTETYTNLARLNREALNQAEKREARPPVQVGEKDWIKRPEDQAVNKGETLALAPVLKPDEAQALAQALALALTEWIKAAAGTGLGQDLHDLSNIKIIGPRYV